jgi:hypothetical protein
VVGYNVQSAVDTQNHIIVAHEVSNGGIDKGHLSSMAARDALDAETIEVLADRGSFKSEELAACEAARMETYVPKRLTSNARAEGRFDHFDRGMWWGFIGIAADFIHWRRYTEIDLADPRNCLRTPSRNVRLAHLRSYCR